MTVATLSSQDLIRRAVTEVASLPEKDLVLVIEFVAHLKNAQPSETESPSPAEILVMARQRAAEWGDLPREELFARFRAASERIRGKAIADGTAIEGEWEGD